MASAAIAGRGTPAFAASASAGERAVWVGESTAADQPAGATTLRFDIPAGSLATVLDAFAQGTRVTVVIDPVRTEGITSPGVVGTFTANERYVDRVGRGHYIPGPGRSIQISSAIGF